MAQPSAAAHRRPGRRSPGDRESAMTKPRILFLCTGNSARSQMAEGLARTLSKSEVDAFSAGTHPKGLHPMAMQVMSDAGIDISRQRSKGIAEFDGQSFDYVITVCDQANE